MKADHFEQQKLLDLAAEDVALTQLAHRGRTLAEVAAVAAAEEAERTFSADVIRAETEARDLGREVKRLESDVETVRAREDKDQRLLDSGSVAPKELTNLQHELESLKRRQSDLEDQELELMERLEVAEKALAAAQQGLDKAREDRERAEQQRDDALADIADQTKRHEAARAEVAGGISAPLLTLYDRIRTQTGTTGAAMLKARSCQGCRIEFYGSQLAAVRNADPHEVVRCENCGRILVRTAESGCEASERRQHAAATGGRVSRRFIVEADGGSRGNPGPAGYGALVRDAETGRLLAERAASVGRATNNVAEYGGLVAGLQAALDLDPTAEVEVRMDSKLVVEQMSGRWQVKHPDMRQLATQAQAIARQLGAVRYTWVPRAQNGAADALANSAMDGRPIHRDAAAEPVVLEDDVQPSAEPAPVVTTVTHLLRHGQTEHTPERRFSGRNELPLSLTGRAEAEAAGERAPGPRGRGRRRVAAAADAGDGGDRGRRPRAPGRVRPGPRRAGLRRPRGADVRRGAPRSTRWPRAGSCRT